MRKHTGARQLGKILTVEFDGETLMTRFRDPDDVKLIRLIGTLSFVMIVGFVFQVGLF
jgi:hypothetical protein